MPFTTRYDVFLSHNTADSDSAEVLAARLRAEGGLAPFLDAWHLIPGTPAQEAVEAALDCSDTVAVLLGPWGLSAWHNEESRVAIEEAVRRRDDYRVIPVLLPGADTGALNRFLARRVWVDFRAGLDDAEAFARLVAGIKGQAVEIGGYELPDQPAPYRGLLRFEAEHARFYFGRDAERRLLTDKLRAHPFVALVGASGSGKSSLVRAGLLPDLEAGALPGSETWQVLTMTPGSEPVRALAEQLATLLPLAERPDAADRWQERLVARPDGLRTAAWALLAAQPRPLLLFIDQFEELLTLCQRDSAGCQNQTEPFIANLADAVQHGDGRIRILITLRADFLDPCLAFPALRDLMQDRQVLLGPMAEADLREVIVKPAQAVGALLEKGLVAMILNDVVAAAGALPLLEHALYELWRARRGPWLTIDAYEGSGGVRGALQRRAQQTYESLSPGQQAIARGILIRLTALGDGVSDTRRRVARPELYPVGAEPAQVDQVLRILSDESSRLVVADGEHVEVAHEALIAQWPTLRGWLETDREALRTHRHLTQATNEWLALGRDDDALYRGARLAQAEEWAAGSRGELNPQEQEFLSASVALREAQRRRALEQAQDLAKQQSKAAARLRLLVGILALLALVWPAFWVRQQILKQQAASPVVTFPASQLVAGASGALVQVPAFEIERYEVSNRQYSLCVTAGACRVVDPRPLQDPELANHPVVSVTAYQADLYCRWLGRRLPASLEWERAARAGGQEPWPWGPESPDASRVNMSFEDSYAEGPLPVDSHPAGRTRQPEGVYNLIGNVWEWTATPEGEASQGIDPDWKEPLLTRTDPVLVIRGGSFQDYADSDLHVWTDGETAAVSQATAWLGFRCAQD